MHARRCASGAADRAEAARNPRIPMVALSTAHPAKFPDAVSKATGHKPELPAHLADLFDRKERFTVLENDIGKIETFVRAHARAAKAPA